jgi:hypothetical protein
MARELGYHYKVNMFYRQFIAARVEKLALRVPIIERGYACFMETPVQITVG